MTIESPENKTDASLRDVILKINYWVKYLKSRSKIIALAGIIGAVLGFLYATFKKPEFVATSTLVLEESSGAGGMGQYLGLASMVGIDLGGMSNNGLFQGENILELYKSRRILKKTLLSKSDFGGKEQLLIDRYIAQNHLREKWAENPQLTDLSFMGSEEISTRVQDSVISAIIYSINKNNLIVSKPDKKLNIIKVQFISKDEPFAMAFNNLVVKNVSDFYIQTKIKKSSDNVNILQHQADSIRKELNSAIYGMASSLDANPNANLARTVLKIPSQKKQIDAEANKAILTELVKNLELSKVSLRKETPLIQLIDSPVMPLKKNAVGRIMATVAGGILFSFLIALFLLLRYLIKDVVDTSNPNKAD